MPLRAEPHHFKQQNSTSPCQLANSGAVASYCLAAAPPVPQELVGAPSLLIMSAPHSGCPLEPSPLRLLHGVEPPVGETIFHPRERGMLMSGTLGTIPCNTSGPITACPPGELGFPPRVVPGIQPPALSRSSLTLVPLPDRHLIPGFFYGVAFPSASALLRGPPLSVATQARHQVPWFHWSAFGCCPSLSRPFHASYVPLPLQEFFGPLFLVSLKFCDVRRATAGPFLPWLPCVSLCGFLARCLRQYIPAPGVFSHRHLVSYLDPIRFVAPCWSPTWLSPASSLTYKCVVIILDSRACLTYVHCGHLIFSPTDLPQPARRLHVAGAPLLSPPPWLPTSDPLLVTRPSCLAPSSLCV